MEGIVVDPGSGTVRVGFSGDDLPCYSSHSHLFTRIPTGQLDISDKRHIKFTEKYYKKPNTDIKKKTFY